MLFDGGLCELRDLPEINSVVSFGSNSTVGTLQFLSQDASKFTGGTIADGWSV